MAVGLSEATQLLAVDGIRLATCSAGIYKSQRHDLTLIEIEAGARTTAVFTQNAFCAAPVIIARQHLTKTAPRYLLINAGNANAGTGRQGISDAQESCKRLAAVTGCKAHEVLPFSTGVIGQRLPVDRITQSLPELTDKLSGNAWLAVARSIMTTDTLPKGITKSVSVSGREIIITGIAKGAGMIKPDMATMLAFIATDAMVEQGLLNRLLKQAVGRSFNRITIDGDTSTNDACVLIATGKSQAPELCDNDSHATQTFAQALQEVCEYLAQAIVRDGEGATKFVTILVEGGDTEQECNQVAYTIAHSPLVKTAMFASDPNWGRILAAVGRTQIDDLDVDKVEIYLDDILIVKNGGVAESYTEEQGARVMQQEEFQIKIKLNRGQYHTEIWTSDLSYEYVKINAEYRT